MFTIKRFLFKVVYRRIYDCVYGPGVLIDEDVRWFESESEFEDWLQLAEEIGKVSRYTYRYQIVSKEWDA